MTAHNDLLSPPVEFRGRGCDAESVLVWPEVGKPGPSGAKAVSQRSVQNDGTDKKQNKLFSFPPSGISVSKPGVVRPQKP